MRKLLLNKYSEINLYKKMNSKSEVITQMIYGDSFFLKKRSKNWLKIKIKEDDYVGFIKNKKYFKYEKPTHKVSELFAKIYKKPNTRQPCGKLTFGSKIKSVRKFNGFLNFDRKWIKVKDVKPIKFVNKNIFSKIKIFKNIRYKWGGKSFKGIDCSALVQVCFNFNNKFCPRDSRDQLKYFKKNIKLEKIKKNDIIFWKGHVAVAISKKNLIHAYGPMKKTVIMKIKHTIDKIKKTANLKVIKVKRI